MKKGDLVATRNPRTGKTEYKKVLQVFRHIAANLVAVSLADKKTGKVVETIRATPEHPFFTTHGLVSAENLGIGTEIVTYARLGASGSGFGSGLIVKSVVPVRAAIGKDGSRHLGNSASLGRATLSKFDSLVPKMRTLPNLDGNAIIRL